MLKFHRYLNSLAGFLMLVSFGASAQVVINETSVGNLQIVDYSGKPPFKRQFVSASELESGSTVEKLHDSVLVVSGSSRRSGPPGKSLSAQVATIERVSRDDISQIARFEETDSPSRELRRWRGAPGKGRRLAR